MKQHASNPVDWYPWGEEALSKSKSEQKPIFLSIGYSSCHWCHVMEHESFEDEEIARFLNDRFVPIKVDREERPDLDHIYMTAVQLMTGRGGWPMSVFLTPDLKPFYGGTYWPARDSRGMAGFDRILRAVDEAWRERRAAAIEQAEMLTTEIANATQSVSQGEGEVTVDLLRIAANKLERAFDFQFGGFGGAPKFPHTMDLVFLLRMWRRDRKPIWRDMVIQTLDRMASGGMYDHLGGGFARYSVDQKWLIPHFEKMLYDNALLTSVYIEAYQATRMERYKTIACETIEYILRDMTHEDGGFFSAEDADSEGVEGKFYAWTPVEIEQALGKELGERFCYVYDISEAGNFEHGLSVVNLPKTLEQCSAVKHWPLPELTSQMAEAKEKLLAARSKRVRPGLDSKILLSWNALMIEAMAKAGAVFSRSKYLEAAEKAARFIFTKMKRDDRFYHSWCEGAAKYDAYLDDYAYLANACITLYEATFDERYLLWANGLVESNLSQFVSDSGAYYYTSTDHEELISRSIDLHDSSVPSGNSMAALALIRLGRVHGSKELEDRGRNVIRVARDVMERSPSAAGQILSTTELTLTEPVECVVTGDRELAKQVAAHLWAPNMILVSRDGAESDAEMSTLNRLFEGRPTTGIPTLYWCLNHTCESPVVGVDAIKEWLKERIASLPLA